MAKDQLKILPSVSKVLHEIKNSKLYNKDYITYFIKSELECFRRAAKKGELEKNRTQIIDYIKTKIEELMNNNMQTVINGTGIVLHTGLGRAPINETSLQQLIKRVSGYTNLEFNLSSGARGQRQDHVKYSLSALTGAESAMVVNNNAAAVLLSLNELAEGKEVIISRGQEVEIGGSFRIPDVIKKSGCILKEVGSTNRTHLKDYEDAINKDTGIILWVHTSNYVVRGFTSEVPLSELVKLGKRKRIPVVADIGWGALTDLSKNGLQMDLLVKEIVKTNPSLVTFSGDKMLGGPQAGIIVGKKKFIDRLKKNPLARAVRCDKWSFAILQDILGSFIHNNESKDNLTIALMTSSRGLLKERGEAVLSQLSKKTIETLGISLVNSEVEAGSGSLPEEKLESMALQFKPKGIRASKLARIFRIHKIPVVGYIKENIFYIDLKAIIPGQEKLLAVVISAI